MALLYKKGYDAGLSCEPYSESWKGERGEKGILYTIDFMKKLIL
jgi:hypothetical protein